MNDFQLFCKTCSVWLLVIGITVGLIANVDCAQASGVSQAAGAGQGVALPNGKFDPALSPDGNQIAFGWNGEMAGNYDVYVQKLCSWPVVSCKGPVELPRRLTTNAAADFGPAWSPDGQHIAFCRRTKMGVQILLVPAGGGPERKLGESVANRPGLAWSADGKFLAMVDRTPPKDSRAIFVLSIETGRRARLTAPPAGTLGDDTPAFSPDGRTLAFTRTLRDGPAAIYLHPLADGAAPAGEPQRLNTTLEVAQGKGVINGLGWTLDGGSLIVVSGGLWKVPVAGGTSTQLAKGEGEVTALSVSRQGRRVVYAELFPELELWRTAGPGAKPEEFPPTRLVGFHDALGDSSMPRDGKNIAFCSFMSGNWEIWKCDSDGKNPVQLTFLGDVATGSPRYSLDGKYVVFDVTTQGKNGNLYDIYVVDASRRTIRRLTKEPSIDIRPCYSKDQRWIYFTSDRTGTFQIWKIPAEGGQAIQVTKDGGYMAFETLDGKFLYYGKSRAQTTLWRVPVEGGEETKVLDDVRPGGFAVCDLGICSLNMQAKPRPAIEFYSFATQKRTLLPVLPREGKVVASGTSLGVVPDGRWLVYVQEGPIASHVRALEYR